MTTPLQLERDAIHLGDTGVFALNDFNNDFDRYIAAHCTKASPGRLVSMAHSASDWPVWEIHPIGDEVVVVMSGTAEFIQDIDGVHRHCVVHAGEAIVNPAGVPHTANVIAPFTALYITPCPDTHHVKRERTEG